MRNNGFTLIDLILTLSLVSILLTVGLPSLAVQIQHARVKTATNHLLDAISLTRTKAVTSNQRATIRKKSTWEDGWEVFIDKNNNGLRDNNENIVMQQERLKGIRISANKPIKNYVSYIGTGESRNASGTATGGFQAGTFTLCPTNKGKGYSLVLARGGRVRVTAIDAARCNSI